jgi:cell volume regulation protein A
VGVVAAAALEHRLLPAGAILALAVLAAVGSRRLRLPLLITFLGLGMLLGSEGVGGIYFDDAELARTIGIFSLIAILFEGGLTSDWREIRPVVVPAFLLSTLGVVVTASVTAVAAYYLFDLSRVGALLLGAVVGSTDAAAVFATLRFTALRARLSALLNAESGANDPMAVALTIGFISWLTKPDYNAGDVALFLVRQLGIGLVIGVALGWLASRLFPRLPADLAPFAPVASVAAAALAYGAADAVDASGFLAVYVVALWLGNTPMPLRLVIRTFHEGLAFIAQVVLFIVLGLLVFPSRLGPVAASSLALTAVLILVARPVAVLASTWGLNIRERVFVAWAGLRGAVPIVLATFALSAGISESDTIFNAVFFVVIVSALAQGLTLEPLARRLGLTTRGRVPHHPPVEVGAIQALGGDILEFEVDRRDAIVGRYLRDLGLPAAATVMLIVRDGTGVPPRGETRIEPGDRLYVLVTGDAHGEVEALLEGDQSSSL